MALFTQTIIVNVGIASAICSELCKVTLNDRVEPTPPGTR